MNDIAKQLKQWRDAMGLSQAAAAQQLQVSVRTLQNWEQSRWIPRGPTLLRLLRKVTR